MLHGRKVVAQPDRAHAEGRYADALPGRFVGSGPRPAARSPWRPPPPRPRARPSSSTTAAPRHWRIENGSHYVRDMAFAEDASRIRKNPDIAARLRPSHTICFAPERTKTSKMPDGAQGSPSTNSSKQRRCIENSPTPPPQDYLTYGILMAAER